MALEVRAMTPVDWDAVRAIYREGIATGDATFEADAPEWREWDATRLAQPRLVACEAADVLGWAALTPVSARAIYRGVADVGLYVAAAARGRGVGRRLLEALIAASEDAGVWTLQAGIFPENAASLALHRGCGFRDVGRRERIGRMNGRWRDTLLLERRSPKIGSG